MKKIFIIIVALFVVGCTGADEGGTTGTTGSGDTLRHVPVFNVGEVMQAQRSARPSDTYSYGPLYDNNHRILVNNSDWMIFVAKTAKPVFDRIGETNISPGAVFSSKFYDKDITTTYYENETEYYYVGVFSDGGGEYELRFSKLTNTFTFKQKFIADVVMVQTQYLSPIVSSYISTITRMMVYSEVVGAVNTNSYLAEGTTTIIEFRPTSIEKGEIRSAEDFDLSATQWYRGATGAYVYEFLLKQNDEFFGVKNKNSGEFRYQFNEYGYAITDELAWSPVYGNTEWWNIIKTVKDTSRSLYGYQTLSPRYDYLVYSVNGEYRKTIFSAEVVGIDDPTEEVINERIALINTIWSNY